MKIGRRLVDTHAGAVHVRSAGLGAPIVFLHWTPWSGRQYLGVLTAAAAQGFAAFAPDHMGYGMSDPRPGPWMIADYADNIAEVMSALDIPRAAVVGGHLSAEIATELVLRHPQRVSHLVLDGSPVWDRAFRDRVLTAARPEPPPWSEDGRHISWAWQRALWLQRMWDPNFVLDDAGAARLREALIESMVAQQADDSAEALRCYDMAEALARLSLPTLALTAETDPLNNCHENVLSLVKGAAGHVFSGTHPLHRRDGAAAYFGPIAAFLAGSAG